MIPYFSIEVRLKSCMYNFNDNVRTHGFVKKAASKGFHLSFFSDFSPENSNAIGF